MNLLKYIMLVAFCASLAACGDSGSGNSTPSAPTNLSVAPGSTSGTAMVSFAAYSSGGNTITGFTVTANPGNITASGMSSPITVTGLTPQTAYTFSVVAKNNNGNSAQAVTNPLSFYTIVETFYEPMTQPNNSIFTGTFTYDATSKTVSNLTGSLTEAMSMSSPMATVSLNNQLSSVSTTLGGVNGLLVTTFDLDTTNTFDPSGFAPGGTEYYGLSNGATNPSSGGVGNAYAMIFVNTADPTATPVQAQINMLAYADCTAGGMMMDTCMTGTTVAGYGRVGTMNGYPQSQVITLR